MTAPQHCQHHPLSCSPLIANPNLRHCLSSNKYQSTMPFLPQRNFAMQKPIHNAPLPSRNCPSCIIVQGVLVVVFFLVVQPLLGCLWELQGLRESRGCRAGVQDLIPSWHWVARGQDLQPLLDPLTARKGACLAWNSVQHCLYGCRQHDVLADASKTTTGPISQAISAADHD